MNQQQFKEWYNTAVWNLPKDFPFPSNATAVPCTCGARHCIGNRRCVGWQLKAKHKLPTVPNMGEAIVVKATIVQKEKPAWRNQRR